MFFKCFKECDSSTPTSSADPYSLPEEYQNSNSGQKTVLNRPKASSVTPVPKATSGPLNRPIIAAKPKTSAITNRTQLKGQHEPDYDKPSAGDENVVKVAWRLAKLAAPLGTGNQTDAPLWSRRNAKNLELKNKETETVGNLTKVIDAMYTNDIGSSSPSSSGIVADASDSATEYPQTSSNLSEHDSPYDYPRPRTEAATKFGQMIPKRLYQQQSDKASPNTVSQPPSLIANHYENANSIQRPYPAGSVQSHPVQQGSTSVLQNVFDGLDSSRDTSVDTDVSSYNTGTLTQPKSERNAAVDDGGNSRKRAVCGKLSDNFRLLEKNIKNIENCTAPQAWRQPHILKKNLSTIKDSTETVVTALGDFLDAVSRIAIDPSNSKIEVVFTELKQLLNPLGNSYWLLSQIKQNIDHTGWTLGSLARPKNKTGTTIGNDALDQFVAVVKQVPADCNKMLQWATALVPSPSIRFLMSSSNDQTTPNPDSAGLYSMHNSDFFKRSSDFDNSSNDSKRCSVTSTLTASSSSDLQTPSATRLRSNFGVLSNNQNGYPVPEVNNSYNYGQRLATPATPQCTISQSNSNGESRVFEEDDLESVLSDRESLSQDYGLTGEDTHGSLRKRPITNGPPSIQLSSELTSKLSDDDRQLLRFYAPQLESHIVFLSGAIEEFLSIVEEQLPPREFVQKGKLIILTAHKLIYIGDNIAQCVSAPFLTAEAQKAADRLCCVLKNCVQATKNAADKYPDVSAVQTMVDSVVTVSHAAYDLKLLVKQCC
ncbi:unnamed protein product [Enterobius vermicularis]|uniref:CAS_C domain-containing protein n=1 Tax=Enterobius vermicularis TaxID=51028 RepID=A0A0N4UWQ6_ENTVE|nr:unnamed protein product [Enterobius vermicularis]